MSHVNNRGIVSEKYSDLSKQIWDLCIKENIWISAVHIPGKQNTTADFMPRPRIFRIAKIRMLKENFTLIYEIWLLL